MTYISDAANNGHFEAMYQCANVYLLIARNPQNTALSSQEALHKAYDFLVEVASTDHAGAKFKLEMRKK